MKQPSQEIVRIEPATIEDLEGLTDLLIALFEQEEDFEPNREKQEHGLRLILEQPRHGRIFALKNDHTIIGMINILFTVSTAVGGMAVLLEDVIVHPDHRGQGYGSKLLDYVTEFVRLKKFRRITLLTDRTSADSQRFFEQNGFALSGMIPMRKML